MIFFLQELPILQKTIFPTDQHSQHFQLMNSFVSYQFLWKIFYYNFFLIRQMHMIFCFIFFQKVMIRSALFKNFCHVYRSEFFKIPYCWNPSQLIFQSFIRFSKQLHIIGSCCINRRIDSLFWYFIKVNSRTSRNNSGSFSDVTAHCVFVIASVPRQSDRNHKVVHIIPNEIKNHYIFFSFIFSESSA